LGAVQALAVGELVEERACLELFTSEGLTDNAALRASLSRAAVRLDFAGRVEGVRVRAAVREGHAVACVAAEMDRIAASLSGVPARAAVRDGYRDAVHGRIRSFMADKQWADAVRLWDHLCERRLVSEALCLDAGQCWQALGRRDEALAVLREAMGA